MVRDTLEPFQLDAVHRLRDIMRHRGGAILADSVGLGKTHVAAALIREEVAAGGRVLVTAPAQLRTHWARHLRGIANWRWVSHTSMSRGARTPRNTTLVVVDEAHAFRNAAAARYGTLAVACEHARVLLLTATPVNNSLLDFYHLLRLFAPEDLFTDVGVPDLFGAFQAAMNGNGEDVRRVAADCMVRRTRAVISMAGSRLRFPAMHEIEALHCSPDIAFERYVDLVRNTVPALTFPAHGVSRALESTGAGEGDPARELMRLGLLKRLESSPWALDASISRHIRLLEYFITAATAGLLFDAVDGARMPLIDGAIQLALDQLVLPRWPPSLDRDAMIDAARHDIAALRALRMNSGGPKLERLSVLLDELGDEPVLLFTEYRDTAMGLWRALSSRGGVAMVHGSDARLGRTRASRRAVIERFAPVSNRARVPRRAERVRLLIATDVLSEGMNLQDARIVVSYDMPWNPVRLAQRIGRIDRLGSPHERIRAFTFAPDDRIEEVLRMMKRIRRKLRHILVVGGDAPALRDARRARRVRDNIETDADMRERVSAMLSEVLAGRRMVRAIAPASATICCFRTATGTLLPVLLAGRRPEVGTARVWALLDGIADVRAAEIDDPEAIERTARRALRRLTDRNEEYRHLAGPAVRTRAAIGRWIADRPWSWNEHDARRVDSILERLRAGRRAGADLRLARLFAATGGRPSIGALHDVLAGGPPVPRPAASAVARLVAILLLERAPVCTDPDVSSYTPTG